MKNIVIVGGTSGIGKAITEELKNENLIIVSRTQPEILHSNHKHIVADIGSDFQLDLELKEIDGLIYCPGTINLKPFTSLKLDDFENDLNINYLGLVRILKQTINLLRKNGNASVVAFSTVASHVGLNFHSSISGAKAAIDGFMRSMAAEYAPKIRFNTISPSLTDTPLASKLLSNEKQIQASIDRHPLKKIATPEEIAKIASWLVSDDSGFITGQNIIADGGLSAIR